MGLLGLPPELQSHILELVYPVYSPLPLSFSLPLLLIHPTLTPVALPIVYRDLLLHSDTQIDRFRPSAHLVGPHVRRLRFIPSDGDGGSRGGVGRGIGTADTLDGLRVRALMQELAQSWAGELGDAGAAGRGLEVLDIASVDPLLPAVIQDLKFLTIGPSFSLPTSRQLPAIRFPFRLTSLALHNNHWQSLDVSLLSALLAPTLKHLDLSSTYDAHGFEPFLTPFSAHEPAVTPMSALRTLRLPSFETSQHLSFALRALALCLAPPSPSFPLAPATTPLRYLELPLLSDPTSGTYDVLWAVLGDLFRSGLREIGLRGWPTTALVELARAVLAAAGMDTVPPLALSPSPAAEGGGAGLRRLRFRKLLVVEELGKIRPGGPELIEQAEGYGVELVCGPREDEW
ncbi:hypothetical protein JCM10207_004639 [Rhodosporidiobolus poonsookiae]